MDPKELKEHSRKQPDMRLALKHMKEVFKAMRMPTGQHFDKTPERVVNMYSAAFDSLWSDDEGFEVTTFDNTEKVDGLICLSAYYSSWCAHHLLPFEGLAHFAYLPDEKIIGASKPSRMLNYLAKQPTTQEILSQALADTLMERLEARFVIVNLTATHTCMTCRGALAKGSEMVTTMVRRDPGLSNESFVTLKDEFFQTIAMRRRK